jgi:pyruvate-formate lyase-activating enzyme
VSFRSPRLLLATPDGTVFDHPSLLAVARTGDDVVEPGESPIPLPTGAKLVQLPGRRPIGLDPDTGRVEVVEHFAAGRKRFRPEAVGALTPPGYTRTLLPAGARDGGPILPQWAYAACGWGEGGAVVWAMRTDRRQHWNPARFSTPDLERRIAARLEASPGNRVLRQVANCSRSYRCFTAQNVFYERDEGAIAASNWCNAQCVGCLSKLPPGGPPSSHERITDAPLADDMAEVATHHLEHARGRAMVSFGQGCEGEPLTRWKEIERAIRITRTRTRRGSFNINTNASLPEALGALFEAGMDAVRVSLNSATPDLYAAYYQPVGYSFSDVERAIGVARRAKAYLALNLLLFPGVTDREGEADRLCGLVAKHRVDQIQTRSLCIDPDQYMAVARDTGAAGSPVGIPNLIARLQQARPGLVIGNFARALTERSRAIPVRGRASSRSPPSPR